MAVQPISVAHLRSIFADREPRTIAHALADILIADGELDRLRAKTGDLTEAEDERWSELELTVDAARDEGRAMVQRDTGVSWDALASALS